MHYGLGLRRVRLGIWTAVGTVAVDEVTPLFDVGVEVGTLDCVACPTTGVGITLSSVFSASEMRITKFYLFFNSFLYTCNVLPVERMEAKALGCFESNIWDAGVVAADVPVETSMSSSPIDDVSKSGHSAIKKIRESNNCLFAIYFGK